MATQSTGVGLTGQYYDEVFLYNELGNDLAEDRQVDWSEFLETMRQTQPQITKKVLKVHPSREAFQLFNVLTPEECAFFIEKTESIGYQVLAGYNNSYRSNTRRIIRYDGLKDIIWDRVKGWMTPTLAHKSLSATWKADGLNNSFRFCRYDPGQHFSAHYDGNYVVNSGYKSQYTFMIYLNGGFDGGATNFLDPGSKSVVTLQYPVLESLKPEAGMLLVFQHDIFHEGERLRSGRKYMMRTDVMYTLEEDGVAKKDDNMRLQQAEDLLHLAEQLELQHKHAEAIQAYRKAYKLAPELEHRAANEIAADEVIPVQYDLPQKPIEDPPTPPASNFVYAPYTGVSPLNRGGDAAPK